jgi:hypothetical protein
MLLWRKQSLHAVLRFGIFHFVSNESYSKKIEVSTVEKPTHEA